MSKYSTEIRYICETTCGLKESVGETQAYNVVKQAAPLIFTQPYEFFDEDYRAILQEKILLHYYTREIGFETVGLFKLKLNVKMREIMPYYNQLYKSALLEFNPFNDIDYTRTHTLKGDRTEEEITAGNTTDDGKTTSKANETKSDTTTADSTNKNVESEVLNQTGSGTGKTTDNSSLTKESTGKSTLELNTTTTNTGEGTTSITKNGENTSKEVGDTTTTGNQNTTNDGTLKQTETGHDTKNYQENKDHMDAYSGTPQGTLESVRNLTYLENARNVTDTNDYDEYMNIDRSKNDTTHSTQETTTNGTVNSTNNVTGTTKDTETGNTTNTNSEKQTGTNTTNTSANSNDTSTATGTSETSENKNSVRDAKSTDTANSNQTHNATGDIESSVDSKNTTTMTGNKNSTANNFEEFMERVAGKQNSISYSDLLIKFRNTFLNIDMMVIDDLSDLFMNIY